MEKEETTLTEETVPEAETTKAPAKEDKSDVENISKIDGTKATTIAREYLEQNFGNVGMLYYRVENLKRNGEETQFYVLCSLLSAFGSKERLYYRFKVNIANGDIIEVLRSKPTSDDAMKITLTPIEIEEG